MAYKWRATLIVAIGLFMAILDNTIVNVALPQMQTAFNTDRQTITWVVTAYFLAQAAVIPITGYLSDRIGTKIVFVLALFLFTLGSGLCALTPQIQPYLSFATGDKLLIAFRVLQGIGGGALFPLAFAIIFRIFPPAERAPASAVVGVPILLAPAFGPTIGGYLTTYFDWSAIFVVNVPIGIIALLLAILVLHGRKAERAEVGTEPQAGARFDVIGLVLAMASSTALVYGITEAAGPSGWSDPTADAYLIVGGVLLVAFIITELVVKDPVMDLRIFINYTFTSANVLIWAVSAFLFGSLFLLPIFFEQVQGKSAFDTGLALISQGLAAAVATILTSRLYNSIGPRWLVAAGFVLITVGTYGFTQLAVGSSVLSLQVWLVLRGLGLGFTNIPLQTLVVSRISNRAMARASSLVNVTRQLFSAVGLSALTTYLLQRMSVYYASSAPAPLQAQIPSAACLQSDIVAKVPGLAQICAPVVTSGMNDTFYITMIGCAICVVLSLLVGTDPSVKAVREARKRGEVVLQQPVMVAE